MRTTNTTISHVQYVCRECSEIKQKILKEVKHETNSFSEIGYQRLTSGRSHFTTAFKDLIHVAADAITDTNKQEAPAPPLSTGESILEIT